MSATEMLRHGSRSDRMNCAPEVGARVIRNGIAIDLIPPRPMEVHFRADVDVVTMSLGPKQWTKAYDSDKLSTLDFVPGQLVYHPKGSDCYARSTYAAHEMIAIFFSEELREECAYTNGDKGLPSFDQVYDQLRTGNVLSVAQLIRRMHLAGNLDSRLALQSVAMLVLGESFAALTGTRENDARPHQLSSRQLDRVFAFVDENFAENPGLTEMARAAGLSTHHFARSFKAATGVSPYQYVMDLRLSRARTMLEEPAATLAEVAYAVGFSSQAHMTDVFRKKIGVTPGRYRSEISE